jgi:protein pelota
MKILKQNLRKGEVVVMAQSLDDLWHLSQVIDSGDFVTGKTTRKVKFGGEEGKAKAEKKTLTLKIKAEKVDFQESSLRIAGITAEAKEDVPAGAAHSLTIEEGSVVTITKGQWLKYQLDKLKEAQRFAPKILVTVFDRETAIFALLKQRGYEVLAEEKGRVAKKWVSVAEENFYRKIIGLLKGYDERLGLDKIILASPAFWKEELMKELQDEALKKKVVQAACSSVTKNAIEEVLKRPELKEALKQDRIAKEANLVEELMIEIAKSQLAAYGLKEVKKLAEAGAVKTLLITNKFIRERRSENSFKEIDNLMRWVDKTKGGILIINSANEPGRRLDGLGGIAALLRFKLSY